MDLTKDIAEATQEIFSTMLGMEPVAGEPLQQRVKVFRSSISGIVGMAGSFKGMLAIHTPEQVALAVTGNFLCMEVSEIDDDVKDAIGELANMLAGSVKTALSSQGEIKLAIPSSVCGDEYTVDCAAQETGVVLPFSLPHGEFLVECQLQKQGDS